jgi:Zn-dependent protease
MLQNLGFPTLVMVFVSLVISITFHEAMHAFTGYWLGDDTAHRHGRISLNPLRHVDPYMTIILPLFTLVAFGVPLLAAKPVPFNPNRVKYDEYGAAMVGLAGPLTNLLLALAAAGFLHLTNGSFFGTALLVFLEINVGLFVFNMIPIPPLDGSRLLYAFAPESLQQFMFSLERYGVFVIFAIILIIPGFSTLLINLNDLVLRILL